MTINLMLGDCLVEMAKIPDASVDMILCDLPYGTTACTWDVVIPFDALWSEYARIAKSSTAIVLTAAQPFTTALISSNFADFKYCWYWTKNLASGFQLAKIQPRRAVEEIAVFYQRQCTYNRQPTKSCSDRKTRPGTANGGIGINNKNNHKLGIAKRESPYIVPEYVSPINILDIECVARATGTFHPTQKPVALMEYLIKTYTNEGDTVLDSCMGSGTTGVACVNTKRRFIGIEKDVNYFATSVQRIYSAGV